MKLALALTLTTILVSLSAGAQTSTARAWKRDTAIVLFSAVGGGILGLSTLSFYGEPQEHTSNVSAGALIGLVAGFSYVIWEHSQGGPSYGVLVEPRAEGAAVAYRFDF